MFFSNDIENINYATKIRNIDFLRYGDTLNICTQYFRHNLHSANTLSIAENNFNCIIELNYEVSAN